jgi:hypothetical protein
VPRHPYDMLLRLYPQTFRRRFGVEMSLDFADGWAEARAKGRVATLSFTIRVARDLAVSLRREWARGSRMLIAASTALATLLLWGLALRPWAWRWDIRPGPPPQVSVSLVTETELLALAAAAILPVIVVLVFAPRVIKRREQPNRTLLHQAASADARRSKGSRVRDCLFSTATRRPGRASLHTNRLRRTAPRRRTRSARFPPRRVRRA